MKPRALSLSTVYYEIHYEIAASKDKDFVVIEGPTHAITPCTACEKIPGQYSNATKNWADYMKRWILPHATISVLHGEGNSIFSPGDR